ncbi:hypothetical protein [Hydrogenovibrio marinus]|uniref:Uncharacterized protein n=1 Tax=Hydrogenovibrio marinus TaxID=28885 RepID=A0A066ZMC7_HYDMR|nr:hypothetical protein [Hydrogenovibrio marinus]KDN94647.1 hypothetical protein EI16_12160 [Hydrogenovibrio marinus]
MSDKNKSETGKRLPLIPSALHTEFKLRCIADDKTMQEGAEEAIRDFLKKPRKEDGEKAKK